LNGELEEFLLDKEGIIGVGKFINNGVLEDDIRRDGEVIIIGVF
jgi:hypothetical protein